MSVWPIGPPAAGERVNDIRSVGKLPNRRDHGLLCQIGPESFANSLCRLKKNTFTHGAPGSQFMCAPYNIYIVIPPPLPPQTVYL